MKTRIVAVLVLIFAFVTACTMIAQEKVERKHEQKLKEAEAKLKEHEHRLHSIEIPEIHVDLSGLEQSMQELEVSLQHLEHIEIPDMFQKFMSHIFMFPISISRIFTFQKSTWRLTSSILTLILTSILILMMDLFITKMAIGIIPIYSKI
jgi:hypothetical protein